MASEAQQTKAYTGAKLNAYLALHHMLLGWVLHFGSILYAIGKRMNIAKRPLQ